MSQFFDKIMDYQSGELSKIETLAFEQELAENPQLQEAYEAWQLTEDLVQFAAVELAAEPVAAPAKVRVLSSSPAIFSYRPWMAAASVLLLLIAGWSWMQNDSTSAPITHFPIAEEVAAVASTSAIPEPVAVQEEAKQLVTKKDDLPVTKNTNVTPLSKKLSPSVTPVVKKTQPLLAEATVTAATPPSSLKEEITTDEVITDGKEVVFQAGKSITLKAGFHAKAGASFVAEIAPNKMD